MKTYNWLQVDVDSGIGKQVGDELREAVDSVFVKKGYQKATKNPDFKGLSVPGEIMHAMPSF